MKTPLIAAALILGFAANAQAESYGKPCSAEPQDKWLKIEAIEKIVADHGFVVAKSKIKGSCAEVYAKDKTGKRVELFIDPATGNPAGTDWNNPTKQ
jgi:hypothetical protein